MLAAVCASVSAEVPRAPLILVSLDGAGRVDTLLSWRDRPVDQAYGFFTLYFDEVDHAGHDAGPAADATTQAVAHVDQAVGRLLEGLKQRKVDANIVIVSDHGMAPLSTERVIRMDRLAPPGSYHQVTSGPYAAMDALPEQEAALAVALLKRQAHMPCWRKGEIPARLAYGRNARVPAFLCLADPGCVVAFDDKGVARIKGCAHGYDNAAPDMAATFSAAGPAIRSGVVLPALL